MDIGATVLWFGVAIAGGGMAGYVFGFWEARPSIHPLAIVGALAIVVALIALAAKGRTFLRSRPFHVSPTGQSSDAKVGLVWAGAAILAGLNIGAFLGFTVGLRTAQAFMDVLSGVGVVAAIVALAAAIVVIVSKRRTGFRWTRRR